ncbi:UNVERIFIED_CONTAM: hypothetical protein PYX00_005525 [Menopon gallinae]|uniref:Uncharacterized protein n=1 Tax=Menopon gallinae TaxID=328185 RepID=A0AAW2HSJ3_9NEOP
MIGLSICNKKCIIFLVIAVVAVAVVVGISVNPSDRKSKPRQLYSDYYVCETEPPDVTEPPKPSSAKFGNYKNAVVTSNGYLCAKIGKDVLLENGTAVDAAIATLICEGVVCPQSMGLGGGFLMTIHSKAKGEVMVLNAREYAPAAASENMYNGNATKSEVGGLSVAVPTELKGYEEAYKRYGGGVSWARLFEPTIKICEEGFPVYSYLAYHLKKYEKVILNSPTLREVLANPKTGKVLAEGELMRRPQLAKTLRLVADKGIKVFYEGPLAEAMVKEVQNDGGILTLEDMKNVEVEWQEPLKTKYEGYTMYSSHLPGSGVLIQFMLNILQDFIPAADDGITYHRITEAFKYGYGRRTELGDISKDHFVPDIKYTKELIKNLTSEKYAHEIRKTIKDDRTHQDPKYYGAKVAQPDDHGTSQISVMTANGDSVSATSTINLIFGSKFRSLSTGIIYNNEMCDFSAPNITNPFGIPPSPANFIKPGKRPLSSMCPTIFLDERNDSVLVTGASGGSRITTSTVLVIINNLIFGKNIKESLDERRIHHQLFPMELDYEYGFLAQNVKTLQKIGHKTCRSSVRTTSTITSCARYKGNVTGSYDYRRGGSVDGF